MALRLYSASTIRTVWAGERNVFCKTIIGEKAGR